MCTRRAPQSTVAVSPGWCVPWRAATLAGPAHAPWAARRDKIPQMAVPSGGLSRPLRGRAWQRAVRGLPGRVGMRPRAVNSPQGIPRRGHASATPWRDAARATGALCVPTCGRPWDPPPGGVLVPCVQVVGAQRGSPAPAGGLRAAHRAPGDPGARRAPGRVLGAAGGPRRGRRGSPRKGSLIGLYPFNESYRTEGKARRVTVRRAAPSRRSRGTRPRCLRLRPRGAPRGVGGAIRGGGARAARRQRRGAQAASVEEPPGARGATTCWSTGISGQRRCKATVPVRRGHGRAGARHGGQGGGGARRQRGRASVRGPSGGALLRVLVSYWSTVWRVY